MENMRSESHSKIAEVLEKEKRAISEAVVDRMYALHPALWQQYGEDGRGLSLRDAEYHMTFLIESIEQENPSLFVQYIEWLKELFSGLHFPDFVIPAMLDTYQNVFKDLMTKHQAEVLGSYLKAARKQIQKTLPAPASHIDDKAPLHHLTRQYLDALLTGDRYKASRLILGAVEKGEDIKNIYLNVFQRSQYEIGRLWYMNKISVAQEHFSSAATQLIMSQLYSYIFTTKKIGKRMVSACIANELHEIGIRMVTDFFELEGWDTYYLGSNTPIPGILQAVSENKADMLALSITMPFNQGKLTDTIRIIRESIPKDSLKIMIGGYAANFFPGLWKRAGADGYARNAEEALVMAKKLIPDS